MLATSYDAQLVLVSLLVAMLASYTALDMAGRIHTTAGKAARWWLFGGAIAMGFGVWSMHFIGMLAFQLPIALGYDVPVTVFSLLLAVLASAFALQQASLPAFPPAPSSWAAASPRCTTAAWRRCAWRPASSTTAACSRCRC